MIRSATSVTVAAACAAVFLAGCGLGSGSDRDSATDRGATSGTTITVTTTPPATSSTATSSPTPETATAANTGRQTAAPAPTGPVFVSCYLADGTARMSDGSLVYSDRCHESAGHPNFDSAEAKSWVDCVIANGHEYCSNRFAPPAASENENTGPTHDSPDTTGQAVPPGDAPGTPASTP